MSFYRHSWHRYPKNTTGPNVAPPGANPKVCDPNLKLRLEKLIANPAVQKDEWSNKVMNSLLDQYKQRDCLSQKQVDLIVKTETKFDPVVANARDEDFEQWSKVYSEDPEFRQKAIKVANWYKKAHEDSKEQRLKGICVPETPFYYEGIAQKVLNDEHYVPNREAYNKLVNNKFAERYVRNSASGPKFVGADIVKLRSTAKHFVHKFPHESALVINVEEPKRNIAGGYIVTVLATGTDVMFDIEERWLLKVRD